MIAGVGVDLCEIGRVERALERAPGLRQRVFAPCERELPAASLAARWAAREAAIKALGGSHGLGWHDLAVARADGRPTFQGSEALAEVLATLGVARLHLSLSHDGGFAVAMVVTESE